MTNRRSRSARLAILLPTVALLAAACGSGTPAVSLVPISGFTPDATLLAAAQKEGTLNVIALPPDWCNYGPMITAFKGATGLAVNSIAPNDGSGDEVSAVTASKGNSGPSAPDVVDVGYSFGPQMATAGLLQPYKVSTWDTIDPAYKESTGLWYGDYYGIMSFAVNTSVIKDVPTDWSDLLKPEYAHSIAFAGDPTVSNQAIQTVEASALANGGTLDNAQPGLDFFKKLKDAGNLIPSVGSQGKLASGETPILITWNYLAQGYADALKGNPAVQVVIPEDGSLRWHLCAGHQRLRAAPERRQAVGGVPLLRCRPAGLVDRVLLHDPPQGPPDTQRDPARARGETAGCHRCRLPVGHPARHIQGADHQELADRGRAADRNAPASPLNPT